jgi:dTDP-4-dehydrorhamnose 3,5-epimerase
MIEGVIVTELRRIPGAKGGVLHAMTASSGGYRGFGEAYFSEITEGAIKTWRQHRRVTMNLVVPVGQVRFVLHDDRAESRTKGRSEEHRIGTAGGHYARLTVPPLVWVAFQGLGPGTSLILDIIDEPHDPDEAASLPISSFPFAW